MRSAQIEAPEQSSLQIEACFETKAIKIGNLVIDQFFSDLHNNYSEVFRDIKDTVLRSNGFDTSELADLSKKDYSKKVSEILGPKFNKRLRAIQNEIWLLDEYRLTDKYCFHGGLPDTCLYLNSQVLRIQKHYKIAKQVHEDGLDQVGPICVYFASNPKALKVKLGKSIWKKLCNNSITTNKYIVSIMSSFVDEHRQHRFYDFYNTKSKKHAKVKPARLNAPKNWDKYKSALEILTQYRPSLIRFIIKNYVKDGDRSLFKGDTHKILMLAQRYGTFSKHPTVEKIFTQYCDTKNMAARLDKPFNPDLSLKKLEYLHAKYTKKLNEIYLQNLLKKDQEAMIPHTWMEKYEDQVIDGVHVEFLRTTKRVIIEGFDMNHCIGGYHELIKNGSYIAAHLSVDNQCSTIGFFKDTHSSEPFGQKASFAFEQHYGMDDSYVEDTRLVDAGYKLTTYIKSLNHRPDKDNQCD